MRQDPYDAHPLTERFEARCGGASAAAADLEDAMRHFMAFNLQRLYFQEPEGEPVPEPRRSRIAALLLPEPSPAFY